MLTITERAAQELRASLSKADAGEDACFRVSAVSGDKLCMFVGRELAGDILLQHDGKTLLAMDPLDAGTLHGRRLDYEDEAAGLALSDAK
jgi:Fe-S cluster assembly iron-binding protein IscA